LQFSSSHHPQTNGQTEVINQSLGYLLRNLIGDNAKQWDLILLQAEFAYNRLVNHTTGKSPFEVVYGRNLITPLDLVPILEVGQFSEEGADQSEQIKESHRKGNTVKVSKCCLVQFSIGKSYKDEVWCEVIPMDAAHILLGRLWKFDGKTKHDRFQNTYSFKKNGVNIHLVPFDSRQTQEEGSNLFMKKTDLEGLMKTSPYVFTLMVVEENEIISEAPLQVQPLLREFADVIPDDIPPGLPALRDIQHCIDFILGSVILNRPAYQMNPKEFAELQR
ncbi:reverse transcriptase domain-containing protein, partial [Tanacetum coccineum]